MTLDEVVAWYQKKIGTYDKQQWEKTVEQRILNGFTHVPLKNAKLRTEYIDVDLVRGSTFPKAKPKQTLLTVIRLAVLRFVFLPLYAKWWVVQTSPKIFSFLLFLYGMQMFNWAVYSYNVNRTVATTAANSASGPIQSPPSMMENSSAISGDVLDDHIVSFMDLLIPMSLSLLLSMIHSQIVATASNTVTNDKRKQVLPPKHRRKRERSVKRRKKLIRIRNATLTVDPGGQQKDGPPATGTTEICDRSFSSDLADESIYKTQLAFSNQSISGNRRNHKKLSLSSCISLNDGGSDSNGGANKTNGDDIETMSLVDDAVGGHCERIVTSTINIQQNCSMKNVELVRGDQKELRRRNVNWDSPIKSHVIVQRQYHSSISEGGSDDFATNGRDDCDQDAAGAHGNRGLEPNGAADSADDFAHLDDGERAIVADHTAGDDDGFESLNGKSSSGEENGHSINATNEAEGQNQTANIVRSKEQLNQTREDDEGGFAPPNNILMKNSQSKLRAKMESSETDEEGDDGESLSSPTMNPSYTEGTTSATEWIGITTNSEECSYSSGELNHNSESQIEYSEGGNGECDYFMPSVILNPTCGIGDRISCTIWDGREAKKAEMSVLDISSAIIERVEAMPETCDYVYIGVAFSVVLSFVPAFCRLCEAAINSTDSTEIHFLDLPALLMEKTSFSSRQMLLLAFGESTWQTTILVIDFFLRLFLTFLFFFLLAVAERTFKQRFLYAKLFSHLTSSRRARKSEVPHFRLNKVRNIKTWLSVRSYLKRRGPQRSVDVIVSAAFILTLLLLAFLSVEWLKDSVQLQSQHTLEALIWSCALGCFLLRFMTLGTKINRKYRSISVLITEQINLYLQIEQKPHNKEELMVSNSVLKLAADLLKELESPFKISGLSANPYLYTTVKVVILSALSGVLSEMLGFKLKLHKIKIK